MSNSFNQSSTLINPDSVYNHGQFIIVLEKILKDKTQLELANQAGINNATLSRIITGKRTSQPRKSTIDKIAKILDDPNLIKELYDAAGYSEEKISEREKIIQDNGFSPDLSALQIHSNFFTSLMRGLSLMTDLRKIEWTIKSGTSTSDSYLFKLTNASIDYWYFRYIDKSDSDDSLHELTSQVLGDFTQLDFEGNIKATIVTSCPEDFDYLSTVQPLQLNMVVSALLYNPNRDCCEDETFLHTAVPLKENIPTDDFCSLTQPIII